MKLRSVLTAIMIFGILALLSRAAGAVTSPVSSLEWASRILEEVLTVSQGGIPKSVLDEARAIAVFPSVTRSDLSGGELAAEGTLVAKSPDGTWTNPAFISLRETAFGSAQTGSESDFILVFRNSESISALEKGPLELGSDTIADGGPLGDGARPNRLEHVQIYSYSWGKKSLAGFALTGAVLQFDRASNEDLYGIKGITLKEIFTSGRIDVPVAAGRFKCALATYTDGTQMCG